MSLFRGYHESARPPPHFECIYDLPFVGPRSAYVGITLLGYSKHVLSFYLFILRSDIRRAKNRWRRAEFR